MSDQRTGAGVGLVERTGVVVIGLMFLPAAVEASVAPRAFYDDFPLGRGWIADAGGAYNEHFVRDVGGLFLALVIVSVWAWWRPALCRPVAVAWLVQGVLHLTFHLEHLDAFSSFDKIAMIGSLVLPPIIAIVVLAVPLRRRA